MNVNDEFEKMWYEAFETYYRILFHHMFVGSDENHEKSKSR